MASSVVPIESQLTYLYGLLEKRMAINCIISYRVQVYIGVSIGKNSYVKVSKEVKFHLHSSDFHTFYSKCNKLSLENARWFRLLCRLTNNSWSVHQSVSSRSPCFPKYTDRCVSPIRSCSSWHSSVMHACMASPKIICEIAQYPMVVFWMTKKHVSCAFLSNVLHVHTCHFRALHRH